MLYDSKPGPRGILIVLEQKNDGRHVVIRTNLTS